MTAVQPELDLFAPPPPTDAERIAAMFRRDIAEQRALWRQPATCPACGAVEPDGYTLFRTHGHTPTRRYEPTWPCRAQMEGAP